MRQRPTLPLVAVPLAQGSLTAVFGMGTGGSSPQWPPHQDGICMGMVKSQWQNKPWEVDGNAFVKAGACRADPEGQDARAISTAWLNMLPCVHLLPIDLVICQGP